MLRFSDATRPLGKETSIQPGFVYTVTKHLLSHQQVALHRLLLIPHTKQNITSSRRGLCHRAASCCGNTETECSPRDLQASSSTVS